MEDKAVNNLILNRLFTRNMFCDLINNKNEEIFTYSVKKYVNSNSIIKSKRELIRDIYEYMTREYRNEYIYKNTLLNKLLLGRHSLNTTSALTEIPIGKSKADFVLINGKGVVYEIKTELDSFDRLESQLNDYYKAFKLVYVVTCESNYKKLDEILAKSNVGICVLTKRNTISTKKEAVEDSSKLDFNTMFKMLRKNEYERIILKHFDALPSTNQFKYYSECYKLVQKIDIYELYLDVLECLKNRTKLDEKEYLEYVPYELRFLIYFSQYKLKDYKNLEVFLNTTVEGC